MRSSIAEEVAGITCFFFSSRRRHTRCLSDWSSDVCSSDLFNALDFSAQGGTVNVSLKNHRRTVDIVVRDRGPGIPEYAEGKVFEKFYSLARPHSKKRSTGLGLPFVKEIVELHQGRATLSNASDGAAVATLSLPLADTSL